MATKHYCDICNKEITAQHRRSITFDTPSTKFKPLDPEKTNWMIDQQYDACIHCYDAAKKLVSDLQMSYIKKSLET